MAEHINRVPSKNTFPSHIHYVPLVPVYLFFSFFLPSHYNHTTISS